jgi:hypothetical protein
MAKFSDYVTSSGMKTKWVEIFRVMNNNVSTTPITGNFTVPAGAKKIRVNVQGPGGNGRRGIVTPLFLGGPGGGAGGRARKTYSVTPGDVFPFVVGAVAVAEGADGAAPTTFGSGGLQIVGNPGGGATVVTAISSGGGAGGTATGGDENATGGRGGHTHTVTGGSGGMTTLGASGGGAPMLSSANVLQAGLPGLAGQDSSAFYSQTVACANGVHLGGGAGGGYNNGGSFIAPRTGIYGGGGGGGSSYATTNSQTSYYFAYGSVGWISVEVEISYSSANLTKRPSGAGGMLGIETMGVSASGTYVTNILHPGRVVTTPIEIKGGFSPAAGITLQGTTQNGLRLGLYDASSRLLIKQAAATGVTSNAAFTVADFIGTSLDDGLYILAISWQGYSTEPTLAIYGGSGLFDFSKVYAGIGTYNATYTTVGSKVIWGSFYDNMPTELPPLDNVAQMLYCYVL